MQAFVAMLERPLEGGDQSTVFGHVVGVDADTFVELGEDVAILIFDDGAVARGPWIAACAAVDVRRDHEGRSKSRCRDSAAAMVACPAVASFAPA